MNGGTGAAVALDRGSGAVNAQVRPDLRRSLREGLTVTMGTPAGPERTGTIMLLSGTWGRPVPYRGTRVASAWCDGAAQWWTLPWCKAA